MFKFVERQVYMYNLWTGLYMLDPYEKAIFSTFGRAQQAMQTSLHSFADNPRTAVFLLHACADGFVFALLGWTLYYSAKWISPILPDVGKLLQG